MSVFLPAFDLRSFSGRFSAPRDPVQDAPSAPTGLQATSGDGVVELAWDDATNVQWSVYRGASATFGSMTLIASGLTSPEYSDEDVENDTLYYYRITATANALESDPSASANATPAAEGGPTPAAPVNTSAPSIAGTDQVGETKTATPGEWTGYPTPEIIGQWQRNDGGWVDIESETGLTYDLTEDDEGLTVRYKETASNASGDVDAYSNASGTVAAADVPPDPPAAPTSFAVASVGHARVNLTWTAVMGMSYKLYRGTDSDFANANLISSNAFSGNPLLPYVDTGSLTDDTDYFYWLVANDGVLDSAETGPIVGTPHYDGPPAVTGLTETYNSAGSLSWTWDDLRGDPDEIFALHWENPMPSDLTVSSATWSTTGTSGEGYQLTIVVRNTRTSQDGASAYLSGLVAY